MYRLRVDDGKLVLQVLRRRKPEPYYSERADKWEDATVEDIPVADPFRQWTPPPVIGAEHLTDWRGES